MVPLGATSTMAWATATAMTLAIGKARGVILGPYGKVLARQHIADATAFAESLAEVVGEVCLGGAGSCREIAAALNARGVKSREQGQWHPGSVGRLFQRLQISA